MTKQPWLRLYRASLHCPKIVTLSDRQHRAWHNCLLIADNNGRLPSMRDVAVHMRVTVTDAEQLVSELVEAGLVDPVMDGTVPGYVMHDWDQHQQPSDSSAERVRKHRENKRNGDCNGDVTLQKRRSNSLDTDTDTDKNIASSHPDPAREKAKGRKQGFDLNLEGSKGRDGIPETLTKRAEGLGLPVAELEAQTKASAKTNQAAYFTTACVNQLRDKVPRLPEKMIRDALWGKSPAAWTAVTGALLMAEDGLCR